MTRRPDIPADTRDRAAAKPRRPELRQPRVTLMGGLLALAVADYFALRTGVVNDTPNGNVVYACAAAVTTAALWLLLPGYSPQHRAASRAARSAMYFALLGLHALAAAIAWTPRRNPAAMVVLDDTGTVLVVAVMTIVSVYAWWCRVAPLTKES